MEFKIKQNITPEDLLQGISWHGETGHDNEAVQKLKELNEFVSDLVQKSFSFSCRWNKLQPIKTIRALKNFQKKLKSS